MNRQVLSAFLVILMSIGMASGQAVEFGSPASPPSRMEPDGSIVTDWGRLSLRIRGEGIPDTGTVVVSATKLDGVIPAAVARQTLGPIEVLTTAFRSPTFPAGTDVVTVQITNTSSGSQRLSVTVPLPDGARPGRRTVMYGGRVILALPMEIDTRGQMRDWGSDDDSTPMLGWGRPDVDCDPAFRNIRAGLGGVPIIYKFSVQPGSSHDVVLGFCESHWEVAGQRPFVCSVEGASPVTLDPLARWGRHKPGAILFQARDVNNDGKLVVSVLPGPGAPDPNPILNAVWIFPAGTKPNIDQVIRGRMNDLATRYVDVGGTNDQALFAADDITYELEIPAGGSRELVFLAGAAGGSAPMPGKTAWTYETLRRAALEVNRDWPK